MEMIGPCGGCIVAWMIIGWCGTGPRRIVFVGPIPPIPEPVPGPDWRRWLGGAVIGIVAGVVGGYAFHAMFPMDQANPTHHLMTFVGAFAVARVAADISERAMGRR